MPLQTSHHAAPPSPETAAWIPQAEMVAGGLLAGVGVLRGSFPGLALVLAGAGLFYHGYRGGCACREQSSLVQGIRAERPDPLIEQSPIDEASWESFPASDPPAGY